MIRDPIYDPYAAATAPPADAFVPKPLYPDLSQFTPVVNGVPPVPVYSNPVQPQPFVYLSPQVMTPPKPILTRAIHDATLGLLSKANELTGAFLDRPTPRPPAYAPQAVHPVPVSKKGRSFMPPVNIDLSDRSWHMFNNNQERHVHYHQGEKKDETKDDKTTRVIVGLIGLTVAFVTAFFVGKAVAEGEEAHEDASSFEELKDSWNTNKQYYDEGYRNLVDRVVKRMDGFLERKQTNRTHKIALLIFGLIAGGTAFAGALLGSGALMVTGAGIGAVASVIALYKLGYAFFSTLNKKDAQAIDDAMGQLWTLPPPVVV
jgi:hypothetical protein